MLRNLRIHLYIWVRQLPTTVTLLCCLWMWRRRTNCRPRYPPLSNPSIIPWSARPDVPGRWDNQMAAQHMPRDLVGPNSGYELSQTMKWKVYFALVVFHVSTDTSVQSWFLVFWFLLMCSSALNWFLTYTLVVPLTLNLPMALKFGCNWKQSRIQEGSLGQLPPERLRLPLKMAPLFCACRSRNKDKKVSRN